MTFVLSDSVTVERGQMADAVRILGLKPDNIAKRAARGDFPGAFKDGGIWTFNLAKLRSYAVPRVADNSPVSLSPYRGEKARRLPGSIRSGIYFVECGDFIKIGFSKSIKTRIGAIATSTPYPVILLASKRGKKNTEADLHGRFAEARHKGEWFRKTPELLDYIEQIKPRVEAA